MLIKICHRIYGFSQALLISLSFPAIATSFVMYGETYSVVINTNKTNGNTIDHDNIFLSASISRAAMMTPRIKPKMIDFLSDVYSFPQWRHLFINLGNGSKKSHLVCSMPQPGQVDLYCI